MRLNFFLIIFFFYLFIQSAVAQTYHPEKVNKKAITYYDKGYQDAVNANYYGAIEQLNNAIKIDADYIDAMLARADIYARIKNYSAAINDCEIAIKKDSIYTQGYLLAYAVSLSGNGNFEKALAVTNVFLSNKNLTEKNIQAANQKKANYEFALAFKKNNNYPNYIFNPVNMGDSINSADLEYLPSITVDGNKLVYNKRINGDEDFYESNKINGVWQKATALKGKLNTNLNEGAQTISQDGQWLIFTGCNYPEGLGSCDLYISYKNKNGEWSEAENLGNVINTDAWESAPSLSADKNDLYFSSNRVGGFGGSDIYVSHKVNGVWQKPENMGATINSSGDDGCPFIHADNQTLYFNSNGRVGYGMSDLYVSRRNEKGIWQQPQNLGYPINTIDDEGSMIVAADGKTAFYASDKGDFKNKIDLYTFQLREDVQAQKTLWVKGKIYDATTKKALPSLVELTNNYTGYVLSKLQTDEDGKYLTTLPIGNNYAFNVNRKGYLLFSENYVMDNVKFDSVLVVDIALQPIEKGAAITLRNIFFKSKSSALEEASAIELNKVIGILLENPKLVIQINGYTDNVGKQTDNILLSINRTNAVIEYLKSKGIEKKRLIGKGFGETKPIANNNTAAGKSANRRIEMIVISN